MTIDQLETPAVLVDLDIMEANIARLADYGRRHDLRLRPHTKTHKIPAIARMQIESGCQGITVAKVGEAEVMAAAGLDDILVAYPIFGEAKLKRLATLATKKRITVAIDNVATAEAISQAAQAAGSTMDLLVEIDVGMRRCGVATPEDAEILAKAIIKLPGVQFAGLNLYPGHIWMPPAEQSIQMGQVAEKLAAVLHRLSRSGIECRIVSGGSTPTAYQSHLIAGLTEIRPGTYVFNDRNTVGAGACSLADCALRVLVTVVSNAVPGRTIVDGGSKTFSSDRWLTGGREGFGLVIEYPEILVESLSEEHGQLDISQSSHQPRIGERFSILPNHVCACVNMHDRIWYHRKGLVEGFWKVEARGCVV